MKKRLKINYNQNNSKTKNNKKQQKIRQQQKNKKTKNTTQKTQN